MKGRVNYRVGRFVRVPGRIGSSARQLTRRRTRLPVFLAPNMRTIMLGNSSGISASRILRHECYGSHAFQLRLSAC
jgi:hypothetical protein